MMPRERSFLLLQCVAEPCPRGARRYTYEPRTSVSPNPLKCVCTRICMCEPSELYFSIVACTGEGWQGSREKNFPYIYIYIYILNLYVYSYAPRTRMHYICVCVHFVCKCVSVCVHYNIVI